MIKFNNIEIKFGDFTAIKDLTLEVKKRRILYLFGAFRLRKDYDAAFLSGLYQAHERKHRGKRGRHHRQTD